jgi:hypothetical protein
MNSSSGGMAATHAASRADTAAWISTRQSKVRDDAVSTPHQPAPSAKEGRPAGSEDDVPAAAEPSARSRHPIS